MRITKLVSTLSERSGVEAKEIKALYEEMVKKLIANGISKTTAARIARTQLQSKYIRSGERKYVAVFFDAKNIKDANDYQNKQREEKIKKQGKEIAYATLMLNPHDDTPLDISDFRKKTDKNRFVYGKTLIINAPKSWVTIKDGVQKTIDKKEYFQKKFDQMFVEPVEKTIGGASKKFNCLIDYIRELTGNNNFGNPLIDKPERLTYGIELEIEKGEVTNYIPFKHTVGGIRKENEDKTITVEDPILPPMWTFCEFIGGISDKVDEAKIKIIPFRARLPKHLCPKCLEPMGGYQILGVDSSERACEGCNKVVKGTKEISTNYKKMDENSIKKLGAIGDASEIVEKVAKSLNMYYTIDELPAKIREMKDTEKMAYDVRMLPIVSSTTLVSAEETTNKQSYFLRLQAGDTSVLKTKQEQLYFSGFIRKPKYDDTMGTAGAGSIVTFSCSGNIEPYQGDDQLSLFLNSIYPTEIVDANQLAEILGDDFMNAFEAPSDDSGKSDDSDDGLDDDLEDIELDE
jgi:hypothetical protein